MITFKNVLLQVFFIVFSCTAFGQTQKDTIFAAKSIVPVIIDGSDTDVIWSETDWKPIDQVWMPYEAKMGIGDFEGKYKVAWDDQYLYVLVQVIDDLLSDDHANPTDNWWADDCLEIFLDENRSKGDHRNNNNAFAYHISLKYDAIDLDAKGNGVNYKNNVIVRMDTIGTNTYLWEVAIKVYDETFTINNPEASRVYLSAQKLMGLTLAYCDNDLTSGRENFIGSMYMTKATLNDNYITADYFGSLLLVDQPKTTQVEILKNNPDQLVQVFPNPAKNFIILEKLLDSSIMLSLEIRSISGVLLKTGTFANRIQSLEIGDLVPGIYLLTISSAKNIQTERIVKQ
jgi:hypothetical protein